jgi:TonB family protein
MSTAEETLAVDAKIAPPLDTRQRGFRIALLCAFLFHCALLIQANHSTGRRLGDASGKDDAIAVDLVTEADLKSRETVALPPPGAVPGGVATPPTPESQPESKPEAPPEKTPPPKEKAETPTPPPAPEAPQEPKPEQPKSKIPDFESVLKDLATAPQPTPDEAQPAPAKPDAAKPDTAKSEAAKPNETKPAEKKAETAQKKVARLAPQSPYDAPVAPPGGGAGATRPPGITRSGENDEFGRGVVRALKATMPPPTGGLGRVTVRLILNENGDLIEVRVLESSGIASLDQRVVFATKQTNFPLPPYKSTEADRTFLISYVYR